MKDYVTIKFAKCDEDAYIPKFKYEGDSGFDLYTVERKVVHPNQRKAIGTGLRAEIPQGYEIQIRPRSGVSLNTTLTIIEGTIDSCYRGEINIIVHNTGTTMIVLDKWTRIAQGVVQIVPIVTIEEIHESQLSETKRGQKGLGHTGMDYDI